ncbi:hypothetical protein PV569_15595 [Streptomyces scabiei]|uniref:hypothetical protein n=1 Tax=Streptomyces scabiei TaxID=1930 RepID=UPI0029A06176|nr:hypothetical protein [Streptomyces scabiei]MDX3295131.1 hypothetical protein [Streptomyces scabiei]
MPTQANAVPPSLVNELAELKRRMSAIERAPAPVNKFDRYPAVEWAAQGRPPVGGNIWSSVSIANATGLTFDRVECKFITDFLYTGKREAEVRLAAFRHDGNANRTIVSASGVLNLTGTTARTIGVVVMRWVHGIPFGWDYQDDTTVYTIELQHRYKKGPESVKGQTFYAIAAPEGTAVDGILNWGYKQGDDGKWWWVPTYRENSKWSPDFLTVPDWDEGSYSLSAMQYCVGLPQSRIPEASVKGWAWTRGTGSAWGRDPNITEDYFGV